MDKLHKLGRGAREQRKKGKHTKGNQQHQTVQSWRGEVVGGRRKRSEKSEKREKKRKTRSLNVLKKTTPFEIL